MVVSTACPTTVDPTVRVHSQRPWVSNFIFARVYELANSPHQKATRLAATIRGTKLNTTSKACRLGHSGAAGMCTVAKPITAISAEAKKPIQIARREPE